MVLLTITPSMAEGLEILKDKGVPLQTLRSDAADATDDVSKAPAKHDDEPSLDEPTIGKPILHGQVVQLWMQLRDAELSTISSSSSSPSLEQLLRGSQVYIPPPPPKPEPSREYKALMARLRRDEEARSYDRMVNPPPFRETFQGRFPYATSPTAAFAEANRPSTTADLGDDEVTQNEVHRQLTLIFNFLVSIIGVAVTLWAAARWWSVPARLFLTMGGSLVVAVAEVTLYMVYVWRVGDERGKQSGIKEVKEVVQTWVVGEGEKDKGDKVKETLIVEGDAKEGDTDGVRRRLAKTKDEM